MTSISVYGRFITKIPVNYAWVLDDDGIYRKRQLRRPIVTEREGYGRYEFYGSGKDLYRAVRLACRFVPILRFTQVEASEFLDHPWYYGTRGRWITKHVDS